jgi:hypothetical protein
MRNESKERGSSDAEDDARRAEYGPDGGLAEAEGRPDVAYASGTYDRQSEPTHADRGVDDDAPGYVPEDAGAATTTGSDFAAGEWQEPRSSSYPAGPSNQTSEPGPSAASDRGQHPEQTSGLDRPPDYRARDVASRTAEPDATSGVRASDDAPGEPFGDHRFGKPDEWSSQQHEWPNRPVRSEEVTSGFGDAPKDAAEEGAGMGAGMYWSGESAREDDEMRGHVPEGEQIPSRGTLDDDAAATDRTEPRDGSGAAR